MLHLRNICTASINKLMYMYFSYPFSSQLASCQNSVFFKVSILLPYHIRADTSPVLKKWPLAIGKHVKFAGL